MELGVGVDRFPIRQLRQPTRRTWEGGQKRQGQTVRADIGESFNSVMDRNRRLKSTEQTVVDMDLLTEIRFLSGESQANRSCIEWRNRQQISGPGQVQVARLPCGKISRKKLGVRNKQTFYWHKRDLQRLIASRPRYLSDRSLQKKWESVVLGKHQRNNAVVYLHDLYQHRFTCMQASPCMYMHMHLPTCL